jgi:hypothetical protein
MKTELLFSVDIDGVLNDYPYCWLEFILINTGLKFTTINEAKNNLGRDRYIEIKSNYRSSIYKENLPFAKDGVKFLNLITTLGFKIVVATSRPIKDKKYPDLHGLTMRWLNKNNINPLHLVFKNLEVSFVDEIRDIKYHIDDELKYAIPIADKNIRVFWLAKSDEDDYFHPNITKIKSLSEIEKHIIEFK